MAAEKLSVKERVLATITRRQPCVSTPILQRVRVNAEELRRLTKELAAEGKIKIWVDGKKTVFTLPDAANPCFAAAIAELEARRSAALDAVEKVDAALAWLRALA